MGGLPLCWRGGEVVEEGLGIDVRNMEDCYDMIIFLRGIQEQ